MAKSNNKSRKQDEQAPVESRFKEKMVALNRVAKVTKGGRTFSFAAIMVIGDGEGTVGHGLGKARDVQEAVAKAVKDAEAALGKKIVTPIKPFTTFADAEDYHQNYFNLNGSQPYCSIIIEPKVTKFRNYFKEKLKAK